MLIFNPWVNEESYASIKNEGIIDENIYLKYLQYECKCFGYYLHCDCSKKKVF
jgi:hypothetical protein